MAIVYFEVKISKKHETDVMHFFNRQYGEEILFLGRGKKQVIGLYSIK